MGCGEVRDMDVVANCGSIRCIVVRPEDFQFGSFTARCRDGARYQVCLRVVILADFTLGIGARRIEVSQSGPP